MPRVQYSNPVSGERITKDMPTPKSITRTIMWLRGARKAVPEIPDPEKQTGWYIMYEEATEEWVRFELQHNLGQRVHVVIFRNMGNFGDNK